MKIIIIAAIAKNGVIGKDGGIPWKIDEDFKRFKRLTTGHPCIMGKGTYESLPDVARPLPGRENIILTSDKAYNPPGAKVFHSFEGALEHCRKERAAKVFVIGGATVYKSCMKVADTLELTMIEKDYPGDTFFPEIDFDEWELVGKAYNEGKDAKNGETVRFSFLTYNRKKRL